MKGLHPVTLESISDIASALNNAEVKYLVVGGIAIIHHGVTRLTTDLDLAIQLEEKNLSRALDALEKLGYQPNLPVKASDFANPEIRRSWVEDKNMLVFQMVNHQTNTTPIDIFVTEPFDTDSEYAKAEFLNLGNDTSCPIVSLETLVEMKKKAGRPKDLDDLLNLERLAKYGPKNP